MVDDASRDATGDSAADEPSGEPTSRRDRAKKRRSFWKELPILIAVALVLTFLIQQFVARPYMIPSGSMEQTLHGCPGCTPDRVLVDKLKYRFTDPKPGEVVVFRGPEPWTENEAQPVEPSNPVTGFFQKAGSLVGLAPPDERDFVKRIVAVGGQTVECCDDEGRVQVDGQSLDEDPYLYFPPGTERKQRPFEEVTVPDDAVWVMGDNRNNSSDSRTQGGGGERGIVPADNIIGKAQVIILPFSRIGGVSDHNPQGTSSR